MRIAVIFENFGPYHLARLKAATQVCDLLAVEAAASSAEYAWNSRDQIEAAGGSLKTVTLLNSGTIRTASFKKLRDLLSRALQDFKPEAVLIPGWSFPEALTALSWCTKSKIPAVVMSESNAWDERRVFWREWIKRRLIRLCSAGLAGGSSHADYLAQLGMPRERIFLGYDVVENGYFSAKAEEVRGRKSEFRKQNRLPENYFLASARFVEKKNLRRLVEAYARYHELARTETPGVKQKSEIDEHLTPAPSSEEAGRMQNSEGGQRKLGIKLPSPKRKISNSEPWHLVLLGDGPLRQELEARISELGVAQWVHMPGFTQYPDLPGYYVCAQVFIHASTTEQWGLVVNEAMASGLPVLVSNRCGCVRDLVVEGVNGFTFDPCNVGELVKLMMRISAPHFPVQDFGTASAQTVSEWGPEQFASGLKEAVETAIKAGPPSFHLVDLLILNSLLQRRP